MVPCPGVLLALALASGGVDLEAGLTAGARARSAETGGAGWQHTLEIVAEPSVALVAERLDWRVAAGYAPRLTAPDVLTGERVDVWQELLLDAMLRATPTLRLEGAAAGAAGTSSLLSDTWRTTGPDPVRTADRVRHFAVMAALSAEAQLTRRGTLTVTFGWNRGGGDDASSREILPVEEALLLEAWFRWRLSRVDRLEARLAMADSRLELGTWARVSTLSGRWRRQVYESLAGWVGAGCGLETSGGPAGVEPTKALPMAEAGVEHALPPLRFRQWLELRAAPAVDRLRGTVDTRVEGEYAATLGHLPGWRLDGHVLAAMTRREPGTDHLAMLLLRLERELAHGLTAGMGLQGSRQRSTDPALPGLVEWIGLVGIEWWPTGRPDLRTGPLGARAARRPMP